MEVNARPCPQCEAAIKPTLVWLDEHKDWLAVFSCRECRRSFCVVEDARDMIEVFVVE